MKHEGGQLSEYWKYLLEGQFEILRTNERGRFKPDEAAGYLSEVILRNSVSNEKPPFLRFIWESLVK
jgi:hypothetical protein